MSIVHCLEIIGLAVASRTEVLIVYHACVSGVGNVLEIEVARLRKYRKMNVFRGLSLHHIVIRGLDYQLRAVCRELVALRLRKAVIVAENDRLVTRRLKIDYFKPIACILVELFLKEYRGVLVIVSCKLCGYRVAAHIRAVYTERGDVIVILYGVYHIVLCHNDVAKVIEVLEHSFGKIAYSILICRLRACVNNYLRAYDLYRVAGLSECMLVNAVFFTAG